MDAIKGVLIDLGGVVYQGDAVIDGSIEAIEGLKKAGMAFRYLTNTTSRPLNGILSKLKRLNIPATCADIFTPSLAARSYLTRHDLKPYYLVQPSLMEDFRGLAEGTTTAVVVGDARDGFTYRNLNTAFRHIQSGAAFIALASNRYFRDDDGGLSLDVGAYVTALEYATGVEAIVLGKPSAAFFRLAVDDMGLAPKDVVMIGDDAEFDVLAAINAGLGGDLVRTGKWQPDSTFGLAEAPTGEFDDLNDAVASILS